MQTDSAESWIYSQHARSLMPTVQTTRPGARRLSTLENSLLIDHQLHQPRRRDTRWRKHSDWIGSYFVPDIIWGNCTWWPCVWISKPGAMYDSDLIEAVNTIIHCMDYDSRTTIFRGSLRLSLPPATRLFQIFSTPFFQTPSS